MTMHRNARLSRRAARTLLDGSPPPDPTTGLGRVLAAAAAPAVDRELAGELDALAMFRAASLAPTPTPASRRPSMLKTTLTKLAATKLLAATAVATAATGGIALAAATGSLPNPLGSHSHIAPLAAGTD